MNRSSASKPLSSGSQFYFHNYFEAISFIPYFDNIAEERFLIITKHFQESKKTNEWKDDISKLFLETTAVLFFLKNGKQDREIAAMEWYHYWQSSQDYIVLYTRLADNRTQLMTMIQQHVQLQKREMSFLCGNFRVIIENLNKYLKEQTSEEAAEKKWITQFQQARSLPEELQIDEESSNFAPIISAVLKTLQTNFQLVPKKKTEEGQDTILG